MCEIRSKLTRKTPEWRWWGPSGIFIVKIELISHIVLVFPMKKQMPARKCYSSLVRASQTLDTAQKMKFCIKDFFSKCDPIRSFLRIRSHLLKKSLIQNLIFCAVRAISSYLENALWYLHKKPKDEFPPDRQQKKNFILEISERWNFYSGSQ